MTKIEKIWLELENDNSFSHGLLFRRYSADVLPDIFVAIKSPEGFRCIATSLSKKENQNITDFYNLKDICVEVIPDVQKPDKNYLIFKLINPVYKDIFSVLGEDLILSVATFNNEEKVFKELINRFEKWRSLFEKVSSHGLSPEEQRGLYGELILLKKLLLFSEKTSSVLSSWVGIERKIRDFQYCNWSIEVKTTFGNNHQKAQINSERQLDTSNLNHLFLFHLSLESHVHSGETLISLIDSIRKILESDFVSLNRFNNKLLEAGYFDNHKDYYSSTGYFIRNENFYIVENDFPRIEEHELRNGVGDVKYSIILAMCEQFQKTESEVFNNIIFK